MAVIFLATLTIVLVIALASIAYFMNDTRFRDVQRNTDKYMKDLVKQTNETHYNNFELDLDQHVKMSERLDKLYVYGEKHNEYISNISSQIKNSKNLYQTDKRILDRNDQTLQSNEVKVAKDITYIETALPTILTNAEKLDKVKTNINTNDKDIKEVRGLITSSANYNREQDNAFKLTNQKQYNEFSLLDQKDALAKGRIDNVDKKNNQQAGSINEVNFLSSQLNAWFINQNNVLGGYKNNFNYATKNEFDAKFKSVLPDNQLKVAGMNIGNGIMTFDSTNAQLGGGKGELNLHYANVKLKDDLNISNGIETTSPFAIKNNQGTSSFQHFPSSVTKTTKLGADIICIGSKCVNESTFSGNGEIGEQGPPGVKGPVGDKGPIGDIGDLGPAGSLILTSDTYYQDYPIYLQDENKKESVLKINTGVNGPELQGKLGGRLSTIKGNNMLWHADGWIETNDIRIGKKRENPAGKVEILNDSQSLVLAGKPVTMRDHVRIPTNLEGDKKLIARKHICINQSCFNENILKKMIGAIENPYVPTTITVQIQQSSRVSSSNRFIMSARLYANFIDQVGQIHAWGYNQYVQVGDASGERQVAPVSLAIKGSLQGKTIVSVAGGDFHALALDSDGIIHGWGSNDFSQLGISERFSLLPIALKTGSLANVTIVAISCGSSYSLALDLTGKIHTWGVIYQGQQQIYNPTIINVPNVRFIAISCGYRHAAAIDSRGTVYTWGNNSFGQLGNGTTNRVWTPTPVGDKGSLAGRIITQVACGWEHTVALDINGTVHSWGSNEKGECGFGPSQNSFVPSSLNGLGSLNSRIVSMVSTCKDHTLALDTNGQVHSWGNNDNGQQGNNSTANRILPGLVQNLSGQSIQCGENFSMCMNSSYVVFTWGGNSHGQLGDGTLERRLLPVSLENMGSLKSIVRMTMPTVSGSHTSMVIDTLGRLHGWGYNMNQQPTLLSSSGSLANKKMIAVVCAHYNHILALDSNGQVHAWGRNESGQLGTNDRSSSSVPISIGSSGSLNGRRITAIAVGQQHSLAMDSNGRVHIWGDNSYGQLGNDRSSSYSQIPFMLQSGSINGKTIVAIGSYSYFSVALDSNGQVHIWGYNSQGLLGNNSYQSFSPVNISTISNSSLNGKQIVSIACGNNHVIALDSGGQIHSWGHNGSGQLGSGNNYNISIPTLVPNIGSIIAISAGYNHTAIINSSYQVLTCGYNDYGQLGDGSLSTNNKFVNISSKGTLSGKSIRGIACGSFHTLAVDHEGKLHGWGSSGNGELGKSGYNNYKNINPMYINNGSLANVTIKI